MKICLINNLYPPYHRGGAEIVVENQAKEFLTQGHDVFVITSKPVEHIAGTQNLAFLQSKIYRFYPLNIISYYHLNKLSFVFRVLWRLLDIFNWQAYFKIKKIFKQEKPDIVYGHNLTGLGLLIPRLIKKLRIKYIQTMHDVVGVRPSGLLIFGKEKEIFLIKLWSSLNRWLYDSPDEVHFPSAWLKNFYAARGFFKNSGKKVLRNFALPPDENLLANKKPKLQGEINFLYLGQIEEHKGILFLIQALNTLYLIHYTLCVVGTGYALLQAKQLAVNNPRIKFIGWQPKEKIQEYLRWADYTILSSLCYENSPAVIFESLSAGVPVIAPNFGGIPELIQDGTNGYLFRPGDGKELISIIKNIYEKSKNT